MVRTKIEVKHIEDVQRRRVCFSKRKAGLVKKAQELSVLCNAEIGVVIFSATGKLFEFATSSIQQIFSRYIAANGDFPDSSHLLAQQAEEIRTLKQKVMMLETDNKALKMDLENAIRNNQRIIHENANMETSLTLRPPCSGIGPSN